MTTDARTDWFPIHMKVGLWHEGSDYVIVQPKWSWWVIETEVKQGWTDCIHSMEGTNVVSKSLPPVDMRFPHNRTWDQKTKNNILSSNTCVLITTAGCWTFIALRSEFLGQTGILKLFLLLSGENENVQMPGCGYFLEALHTSADTMHMYQIFIIFYIFFCHHCEQSYGSMSQ